MSTLYNRMRLALLALSTLGLLVFGGLLAVLLSDPAAFETRIRGLAVAQVKESTAEFARERGLELEALSGADEPDRFGALADAMQARSEQYGAAIEARLDAAVANWLTRACALDCERREATRKAVRDYIKAGRDRFGGAADTLRGFALGRYDRTVRGLHRSLVIVCLSNIVVFGGIIALTVARPRFMPALVKIGALAFISVAAMSLWYVAGQDWISAILFNSFVGWGYAVFMGVLFLALLDVALNRARVLGLIMNVTGSVTVGISAAC